MKLPTKFIFSFENPHVSPRKYLCSKQIKSDVCSMLICIIYTYKYTHLVRAKRGEAIYNVLCIMYYFILCTHITKPLLLRAERGEKNLLYYVLV